ncbi:MAG: helicase-related protein [Candidatus Paceibacterota bacterium]
MVGTHALIQKNIDFEKLGLVIIDEQHRFGIKQRRELLRHHNDSKNSNNLNRALLPHFLSMTATPIPRTLALSIYGDLDLSILDEMPKNRKAIITKIVTKSKEKPMFEFIHKEIKNGRQAFVICPRIEIAEETNEDGAKKAKNLFSFDQLLNYEVKAVKKEVEKMKKVFPKFNIEMLHGKMKSKEKELIMRKFYNNEINLLVATSVIEVGIDVPNASVMLIMGTESFGLAQLHQFRGRVGRGNYQSYCFLYTESNSKTTKERLDAMVDCHDGFKLAEIDLKLRGPGEMFGKNQSGFPDLAMTAIKDSKLLKNIQDEAKLLFATDPDFKKYPLFLQKYKEFVDKLHLE